MYVFICPCIADPTLRAEGITSEADINLFRRAIERCERFGIEAVPMPCPETEYLGKDRTPGNYVERLNTPEFATVLDRCEERVREIVRVKGEPLCFVGVDSSPACGVRTTYFRDEKKEGRGAFLARFHDTSALDVEVFARYRVYLAAPLFTEAEQAYNRDLHALLERHLFEVYLPQDIGDTGHAREKEEHKEIFESHLAALNAADFVVAVIDGADADSGTAWEMGYASARGVPVISLRTDFRRVGHHEHVNLMLEESSTLVLRKEDLPKLLNSPIV